jgi:membrane protease YdiL (CAAX protease family)
MRPFFRACLYLFFLFPVNAAASFVARHLAGVFFGQDAVLFYVVWDASMLVLAWLMLRTIDLRSFRTQGLWFYGGWIRESLLGIGIGAAVIVAVGAVEISGGWLSYQGLNHQAKLIGFVRLAVYLLVSAAHEEILFRGYAFQRLVDSLGKVGATVLSASLFLWAHHINPFVTPLGMINTFLAGVLLCLAYLKTRALWLPLGIHWGWNFVLGPMFSVSISGFRPQPMLFRSTLSGPEWLTGGNYGFEASAVLGVVCLAFIFLLARSRRISPSPEMAEALK